MTLKKSYNQIIRLKESISDGLASLFSMSSFKRVYIIILLFVTYSNKFILKNNVTLHYYFFEMLQTSKNISLYISPTRLIVFHKFNTYIHVQIKEEVL